MYAGTKRYLDIVLCLLAIFLTWPVLVIIASAIKLTSPGPVLFKQKRVGQGKQLFEIYKFRTMRSDTPKDTPTHLLQNPETFITPIGKLLRKTSLDELPQIFNIFKGEMSIIGPRPALWNQDDLVEARDRYGVNDLAPGLTGWAQINGRDELPIPVKARLDGEYAQQIGLWFDVKIFWLTVWSVMAGRGVVEGGTGQLEKETFEGVIKK
jgi:lipopolysaccharide/colanic/teichoic acid biosynthesis glycosyltransferase